MGFDRSFPLSTTVILLLLVLQPYTAGADERCTNALAKLESALVRTAADRIDSKLSAVAESTRALGDTVGRLAGTQRDEQPLKHHVCFATESGLCRE